MGRQQFLERMLSSARLKPYMDAAKQDVDRAEQLYRFNSRLAGALHVQLSHFEVILRNTIDSALQTWISSDDWTSDQIPANYVHTLIAGQLDRARSFATQASNERRPGHPRAGQVTHDDVVTQLSFGAWSTLLGESAACAASSTKKLAAEAVWVHALSAAFPYQRSNDMQADRERLGKRVQRITDLRNRVSHQENLLEVKVPRRLNDMIAVLASINPAYPGWFMSGSKLRAIAKSDPRAGWERGHSRSLAWK